MDDKAAAMAIVRVALTKSAAGSTSLGGPF